MILYEFKKKEKNFSIDNIFALLEENDNSIFYTKVLLESLLPLRLFLSHLEESNVDITKITIEEKKYNRHKLYFQTTDNNKLLEKYHGEKYLENSESGLSFSDSVYYSKYFYNYDPKNTPYIKPRKNNPLGL